MKKSDLYQPFGHPVALAVRVLVPPLLIVLVFWIAAFQIFLPALEETHMNRKREMLQRLVEIAIHDMQQIYNQAQEDSLPTNLAKKQTLNHLSKLRYGEEGDDYFWIIDTELRMLMHPYQPELVRTKVDTYKDPAGTRVFSIMLNACEKQGHGFVQYQWQWKKDPKRIEPKLSYVQLFKPWGWIVGTGVYLNDVETELVAVREKLTTTSLGLALLAGLISLFISWKRFESEQKRKNTLDALSESERKYRCLFEDAAIGIFQADINGFLLSANPAMAHMFGCDSTDEFIAIANADIEALYVDPSRLPKLLTAIHASADAIEDSGEYYRMNHTLFSGRIHIRCIRNETGTPIRMEGFLVDVTEQKRLTEELHTSAHFQKTLLDAIGIPIFYKNADGIYLGCNPAFEDFFGLSSAELTGKAPHELFPPDLAELYFSRDQDLYNNPGIQQYEASVLHALGERRTVIFTKATFLDEHGAVAGLIGAFIDITELRNAQEALEIKEAKHQTLFAAARTMQFSLNLEGRILDIDTLTEHLTGYRADEIRGQSFAKCFLPENDQRRLFHAKWETLRENGELRNFETLIHIKSGYQRTIILNATFAEKTPVRSETEILMSGQDITELHIIRQRQRILEQRLSEIQRNAPVVLLTMNAAGHVLYLSQNIKRIFGFSAESLTGETKGWKTILHPEDVTHIEEVMDTILQNNTPVTTEFRIAIPETTDYAWARAHASVGYDIATHQKVLIASIINITKEKKAREETERLEEQLVQSEKMRAIGELAGGIAHDFNNLLTGIMGNAEILGLRMELEPREQKYLDSIIDTANQAADLVRQIKTFARKESVRTRPVELHKAVRGATQILSHSLNPNILLKTELTALRCTINGDSSLLQNAILNLGLNARDAMPNGGSLLFRTKLRHMSEKEWKHIGAKRPAGDYIELTVKDTGEGIAPEKLGRIFEPFFTTKPEGKGTGLGLASVYGCIEMHQGYIDVTSTPGKGTIFFIFLPLIQNAEKQTTEPTDKKIAATKPKEPALILLVDDEPLIRQNAGFLITKLGYQVKLFGDGYEALRFFRNHIDEVKLVILDRMMPKISGDKLFEQLKQIDPHVNAIITTGFVDDAAIQLLRSKGIRHILHKPFKMDDFIETLETALRERQS